jgi:hypothetical protein
MFRWGVKAKASRVGLLRSRNGRTGNDMVVVHGGLGWTVDRRGTWGEILIVDITVLRDGASQSTVNRLFILEARPLAPPAPPAAAQSVAMSDQYLPTLP